MGMESPAGLGNPPLGRALDRLAGRGRLRRLRRARAARLVDEARRASFEAAAVLGLFFASICIQVIVPMGAPPGYDLTKWASVNYLPGSSGYFQIARAKGRDRSLEIPGRLS